jgi:hypothetical protein
MKKLTRILALTLCCLLAAGLAACGETPAPTPDPDPDPGSAIGGNTQIPNPRVPYENDEFPDFKLVGYPDRDGMKPTGFCLIGGTIGEISYETATLRCAADTGEGEDLSGVYYPDAEESELSVGHSYCNGIITVTVKEHSEGTVALWKSCEGDFVYSLWLPGQTGDDAKALVREFAAGVYVVLPGGEEPLTGDVLGTEKDLARWREAIHADNIAKVTAKDYSGLEPVESSAEAAEKMIEVLADSESALKLLEKPQNPATGGALRLTAYDTEGNVLFTVCYNGLLVVTFGQETANYIFDASDCELCTLYTFFPVE